MRCVAVGLRVAVAAAAACWMHDCLFACGVSVHGVVYVFMCVLGDSGCACGVCGVGVDGVLDGVIGATVVLLGVS